MTQHQVVWLPGYFTGRLHAATIGQPPMVFHHVAIVWSLCGVPVAVFDQDGSNGTCDECARRLKHCYDPPSDR